MPPPAPPGHDNIKRKWMTNSQEGAVSPAPVPGSTRGESTMHETAHNISNIDQGIGLDDGWEVPQDFEDDPLQWLDLVDAIGVFGDLEALRTLLARVPSRWRHTEHHEFLKGLVLGRSLHEDPDNVYGGQD